MDPMKGGVSYTRPRCQFTPISRNTYILISSSIIFVTGTSSVGRFPKLRPEGAPQRRSFHATDSASHYLDNLRDEVGITQVVGLGPDFFLGKNSLGLIQMEGMTSDLFTPFWFVHIMSWWFSMMCASHSDLCIFFVGSGSIWWGHWCLLF